MIKKIIFVLITFALVACGSDEASNSLEAKLKENNVWPHKVVGTIDLVDAGAGDSDYATWAIGILTIGKDDIMIEFEQDVLEDADIDLEFEFADPQPLMLGKPKEEHGMLSFPVEEIL